MQNTLSLSQHLTFGSQVVKISQSVTGPTTGAWVTTGGEVVTTGAWVTAGGEVVTETVQLGSPTAQTSLKLFKEAHNLVPEVLHIVAESGIALKISPERPALSCKYTDLGFAASDRNGNGSGPNRLFSEKATKFNLVSAEISGMDPVSSFVARCK